MTHQDAFEGIVASINEAMLDDARWPDTSAQIDEACGAKCNALVFGDCPQEDKLEVFFGKYYQHGEDRSEWGKEYFQLYHPTDERLPRLRRLPDSKIVPVKDLLTESELKASLTYNVGLPSYDMQMGLNVRLDGPGGSRIVWGIGDPVAPDGWSSSRIKVVARLLPHLRQYVRVRAAVVEAGALGASVTELLDNTSIGIIQLDRGGRIVETNDSAGEVLRANDGLSDERGELRATWPADNSGLRDLLARALPRFGRQGVSGSMTVRRRQSLQRIALHVKPVAYRGVDYHSRHVAALVLVAAPTNWARVEPALVGAVLGLTPAEAAIAVLLAEGQSVRQIAAATGRKYGTVRTHLKHIFVKLGCSRQFDVVQAVQALSRLPRFLG